MLLKSRAEARPKLQKMNWVLRTDYNKEENEAFCILDAPIKDAVENIIKNYI